MFADDGAAMAGGDDGPVPASDDAVSASAADDGASASNDETESSATDALDFDFEPQDFSDGAADGAQSTASANGTESNGATASSEPTASNGSTAASSGGLLVERESSEPNYVTPAFLHDVEAELREIDEKARRMLAYYVEQGPDTPLNAHFSAGGSGDRTSAYAYNRQLRLGGFIEHAGCGRYEPVLRQLVSDEAPANVSAPDIADAVVDLREVVDTSSE